MSRPLLPFCFIGSRCVLRKEREHDCQLPRICAAAFQISFRHPLAFVEQVLCERGRGHALRADQRIRRCTLRKQTTNKRVIVMAAQIRRNLYAEVTSRILAELERGAAPWVKPWSATPGQNVPQNAVTNRPYSGCNVILLWLARNRGWATPRFLTFKQAIDAGGNVRKGEHGTKVYFVKQLQIKDGDDKDTETRLIPMMREYTVFN